MPCNGDICDITDNVTVTYLSTQTSVSNGSQENITIGNSEAGGGGGGPLSDDSKGLMFLFSLTTVLAIVGNCFVVLVFARGRRSRTDLRPFLINLAIADLIMSVFCMPFTFLYTMLETWIFTRPMCPIVLFVQCLSVLASVFTNMAIGTDRFLAVMFPLRSRLTNKKAKYVIILIWSCSIAVSLVQFHVAQTVEIQGKMLCQESWETEVMRKVYTVCLFVITYVIPLTILAITYTIVGIILWKRTSPGNRDHLRDMHQLRSKRKVVKMLVIVVAMFGVCWLPLHLFTLMIDFYPEFTLKFSRETLTSIFISCHWLAMSNSFANPIIYGFTNESFRADLVTLFYMWFPCCVCLTKMMPRQASGSTYETVVYRRQSLYKQGAKIGGTYHTRTVRGERSSKTYLNGHRSRYDYSDLNSKTDKNRNKSGTLANGCGLRVVIATNEEKELLRLAPVSISYNSEATNGDEAIDTRPNGNS